MRGEFVPSATARQASALWDPRRRLVQRLPGPGKDCAVDGLVPADAETDARYG
jgi:hypothetical protein